MADDERPRIPATFDSYDGMLNAIRARVNELQVTGTALDHFIGLPLGYYSKLAGANPIRRLGMTSLAPVLNGLGLKCQFVEDQEATLRLKKRVPPRNGSYVRAAPSIVLTVRFFKKIGRMGAQARIDNSTKEQRQAWGEKSGSRALAESHVMSATQCPLRPPKSNIGTQPRPLCAMAGPVIMAGSRMTAARVAFGAISLSVSSHFPLIRYNSSNQQPAHFIS